MLYMMGRFNFPPVRRFFSGFPDRTQGAALLMLRLSLATSLFVHAAGLSPWVLAAGEIATGTLLAAGLWTPVAGLVSMILQLGILILDAATPELHLLRASMGLSLALLGPGAWSIDARLFGRRRVEIGHFQ